MVEGARISRVSLCDTFGRMFSRIHGVGAVGMVRGSLAWLHHKSALSVSSDGLTDRAAPQSKGAHLSFILPMSPM